MRRPMVVISLALSFALAVSLVGGWAATTKPNLKPDPKSKAQDKPITQTRPLPEHLFYWHMFQHKVLLDQKAKEVEEQGQDGSVYRSRYKTFANLSDREARIFERAAHETYDKVKAQDAKAKQIIDALRAQPPDSKFQVGQGNPEVPAQLEALQKERDELVRAGMTELSREFGPERFAHLDQFVRKNIAPNFKNLTPDSVPRNFDPRTDPRIQQMIENLGRSK